MEHLNKILHEIQKKHLPGNEESGNRNSLVMTRDDIRNLFIEDKREFTIYETKTKGQYLLTTYILHFSWYDTKIEIFGQFLSSLSIV